MILSLLWSSIFCSSILLFVINYLWKICLSMLSFLSGQIWRGNPGSRRSGMDPMPPRQSRQGAAQAGLRQCIQPSLPTNRFDQNYFYLPRSHSLGDLVPPTSFGPSVWRSRHPVRGWGATRGSPWPPVVCHRCPHLNARSSSRAPGLSAFLSWRWHWCWRCGCGWCCVGPYPHLVIRAWPYVKPSKCGFAGVGSVQPDDMTGLFPAELLSMAAVASNATLNSSALLLEMMVLCRLPTSARWGSTASRSSVFPWGCPLLRTCASNGRMLHGMRWNSPLCQLTVLQQFDSVVQAAFSSITGLHLIPFALLHRHSVCRQIPPLLLQFTDLQS